MTATKLPERLPGLLDELAQSTPIDGDGSPFVPYETMLTDHTHHTRLPRQLATVAAAGLVIIGAGALALTRNGDETPASGAAAQTPTADGNLSNAALPTHELSLFPVLDDPPLGLTVSATTESIAESPLLTEALIGRVTDSSISDTIAITVQSEPFIITAVEGRPATTTEVFGQPATVYNQGIENVIPVVHVTWGSGPYYLASGPDPITFLNATAPDTFVSTSQAGDPPELSIGSLPDEYRVIAEPHVVGHARTGATLSIGADNYDISVSTRNPIISMAQAAPLRLVDVNGHPGWMFDTSATTVSRDVAWKVDDSTYAYLKVNHGTNALDLAKQVTFVDRDTWTNLYLPDQRDIPTSSEPINTPTPPGGTEPAPTTG